jgi:hypothetical protein
MSFDEQANRIVNIDAGTIGIRLQEGSTTLVDRADFEALKARGVAGRWFLSTGAQGLAHVRMRTQLATVTPARLIANAKAGEVIRYTNGSRLDLRRQNLKTGPRRGGLRQRALATGRYLASVIAGKNNPCQ